MDRFPHDAEAANEQLLKLIGSLVDAIETDIFNKHVVTTDAIAERLESIEAGVEEASVLVRAAVIGRTWLVGERIAGAVQLAIYQHASQLAQVELADMEKRRQESHDEQRLDQATWARAMH